MSGDIFVPTSHPADAIVQPLHTITYVTADKDGLQRTLCEGFELEATPWFSPSQDDYELLNPYLGFPASSTWEACAFASNGAGKNVQIRVIHVHEETPLVRPSIDGRYIGGASIGFPMANIAAHEERMSRIGVESSVGIKEMEFTSPNGEVYISAEIHFLGAENIFLLGVRRPEIFVPVGPIDPALDIGGAAYSARCVTDTEKVIDFFQTILGFEIRRDVTLEVGERSGLKLEQGSPERFVQAFAPGASSGYVVFLDHEDETTATPAPTLGPPSRGVAMWSFPSENLERIYAKAKQAGIKILHEPGARQSPFLPNTNTLLLEDPGGFPIEIFEV